MNKNEMQEHIFKEELKKIVDNSPNYSNQMKWEIKGIIDTSRSQAEIVMGVLSYFSMLPWR